MATIVLLFGATNGYPCTCTGWPPPSQPCGDCTADKIFNGECFKTLDGKFIVEIIPDGAGNFPWTIDGNSVFKYRICQPNPTQNISHINIQVGECGTVYPYPYGCISTCQSSPSGFWITAETGESSTRFSSYDPDFDVYKWGNLTNFCYGEISLTMNGIVYASKDNLMLLKYGSSNFPVAHILGPSCKQPERAALTTKIIEDLTVGRMECVVDLISGKWLGCFNEAGVRLNEYPVGSVECTLTGDTGTQHMKVDSALDGCFLVGGGSPDTMWYYNSRLKKWICKCVAGPDPCTCP